MISLPGSRSRAKYMLVRALEPFMWAFTNGAARVVAPFLLEQWQFLVETFRCRSSGSVLAFPRFRILAISTAQPSGSAGNVTALGPPETASRSVRAVAAPLATTTAPPALRNIRRFGSVIVVFSPRHVPPCHVASAPTLDSTRLSWPGMPCRGDPHGTRAPLQEFSCGDAWLAAVDQAGQPRLSLGSLGKSAT